MIKKDVMVLLWYTLALCFLWILIGLWNPALKQSVTHKVTYQGIWQEQIQIHSLPENFTHAKWIIINLPKDKIDKIHFSQWKVPGWVVLFTGPDGFWLPHCRPPNCFYLCPSIIVNLTGLTVENDLLLTSHTFGLSGYIFAMNHGAQYILKVNQHVSHIQNLNYFSFENQTNGIVYHENVIFDPKIFQKDLKQRTNLKNLHKLEYPFKFSLQNNLKPVLQFPLYECETSQYFEEKVPDENNKETLAPLFVYSRMLKMFSSDVVLYGYETFWTLFVDFMNHENTELTSIKILLKYFLNKFNYIVQFAPGVKCTEYKTSKTQDFNFDKEKAKKLWRFFKRHKCVENETVFDCIFPLAYEIVRQGHSSFEIIIILQVWMAALNQTGYKLPEMLKTQKKSSPMSTVFLSTNIYSDNSWKFKQDFSRAVVNYTNATELCPNLDLNWSDSVIDDVMLIVTFNEVKYYSNIVYLELMYRRYFRYILFCGPQPQEFMKILNNNPNLTTFLYVKSLNYTYECMQYAMMLNFRVKGYMQITCDTLINVWKISPLLGNQIILPKIGNNCGIDNHSLIRYNNKMSGILLREIENDSKNKIAILFLKNDIHNFKERKKTDKINFYYIPDNYKDLYIYISNLAQENKQLPDLAFLTMLYDLEYEEKVLQIPDSKLNGNSTQEMDWICLEMDKMFSNPFLTNFTSNYTERRLLCDTIKNASLTRKIYSNKKTAFEHNLLFQANQKLSLNTNSANSERNDTVAFNVRN